MAKRLLLRLNSRLRGVRNEDYYRQLLSGVLNRCLSQSPRVENVEKIVTADLDETVSTASSPKNKLNEADSCSSDLSRDGFNDAELSGWRLKLEFAWLSRALEPALLQLYKWASFTGTDEKQKTTAPSTQSLTEILNNLQRSKKGIRDWSLGDLTVALYLIYLSRASADKVEEFNGVQIFSDAIVQELIYHIELAKGAYKDNATALARHSMLRERNVLKFVRDSSVMRPGYYIGIDTRNKLVVFGIRGTHTVYDLITDVVSSSDQKVSFEGFSTHFGTAEAARWYLRHEMGTIKKCLEKHKGYKLRLVGHSLGGAAAALLAIMLRRKSKEELGFSPDIVSAVGFGTPPCVSRELAENCASYVSTVVLQDDIVPRLSTSTLARLRNEILETDWMTILEKEDLKGIIDIVTNAKLFVSSVQDVARKFADYAKFRNASDTSNASLCKSSAAPEKSRSEASAIVKQDGSESEELFAPGTLYYIKRQIDDISGSLKSIESYTLWKRHPGEHFERILLSGNLISDHKCDNHYYALRDVLKSLPIGDEKSLC
ncbi:Sn1-specific diacylglycerol lipase alpha [Ananas comosus]|uniref:Sn1-specific diacylglycerol lipase alpha n=1 Tax=Ananas comosus TaxID=4615 RepID=A0A199URU6_ANACO|nr:Sn1-specific diacylglycerol lipase alpha [Ananas comosus]